MMNSIIALSNYYCGSLSECVVVEILFNVDLLDKFEVEVQF
jgi:hypothetical protein